MTWGWELNLQRIGLFGGTFDPVHNAHLRLAIELKQYFLLDEMRLLPAHIPPHKDVPGASAQQRLQMLQLALQHCSDLRIDSRELERNTPSYTIDTLEQIRAQLGPDVGLYWAIGGDSLATLNQWHRWRELLDFAHLIVAVRPGYQKPVVGAVAELLAHAQVDSVESLATLACGRVHVVELSQLAISATHIRAEINRGCSAQFLLPDAVWQYVQSQQLYQNDR